MTPLHDLILFLVCYVGSAFFSGMETGVISIHPLRLRHMLNHGVRGAQLLDRFTKHPDYLLGTTLVGTNICNVICSITATSLAIKYWGSVGYVASSIAVTILILIGGEYLPKAWFQSKPAYRTRHFAGTLHVFGILFYPVSWLVTTIAKLLLPARRQDDDASTYFITKEELAYLTREGEQAGELTRDEGRMIDGVFALAQKACREIMIPRESIVYIHHDASSEDILQVARTKNRSRFPVFMKDADRFVGIVHVFDVMADRGEESKLAQEYMRPPQFVSEETTLSHVLPRMRLSQQPVALLTDSNSYVVGMITIEDIMNEIQNLEAERSIHATQRSGR